MPKKLRKKIREVTIRELTRYVTYEMVERALRFHYPSDSNDYRALFKGLGATRRRKHRDPKEKIVIRMRPAQFPNEESTYDVSTNKYSLSLRPWSEVANIPISKDALTHYTPEEIVAHFIWDITFYGCNEDEIKGVESMIRKAAKEATC